MILFVVLFIVINLMCEFQISRVKNIPAVVYGEKIKTK